MGARALKSPQAIVWPTPFATLPVAVVSVDGYCWHVGDHAYVWQRSCTMPDFDPVFDCWVKGEIKALYSSGSAELDTGGNTKLLSVSVSDLAHHITVEESAHRRFQVNSRIVLLDGAHPRSGMEGFVISVQDAEKHDVPGIALLAPEGYVPAMLDMGYAGAWKPHVLGLIAGPEATTVPIIGEEPKNNDGRGSCFWCGAPTRKIELVMSHGDICTSCGR